MGYDNVVPRCNWKAPRDSGHHSRTIWEHLEHYGIHRGVPWIFHNIPGPEAVEHRLLISVQIKTRTGDGAQRVSMLSLKTVWKALKETDGDRWDRWQTSNQHLKTRGMRTVSDGFSCKKFCISLFVRQPDNNRYGRLQEHQNNAFLMGDNKYTKIMLEAMNLIKYWQGPSSGQPSLIADKEEEGVVEFVDQGKTVAAKKSLKG